MWHCREIITQNTMRQTSRNNCGKCGEVKKTKQTKFHHLWCGDLPHVHIRKLHIHKFMSCSCDITLIITHTASQRAPRRKKWTVSESEVAKPNLNTLEVITQKERKKKKMLWRISAFFSKPLISFLQFQIKTRSLYKSIHIKIKTKLF